MTDAELEKCLRATGKDWFVTEIGRILAWTGENTALVQKLCRDRGDGSTSVTSTRLVKAKKIIDAGRVKDALLSISFAEKVSADIRAKATVLADALYF